MADLYLIRHGQASLLSDDYDKLSTVGETQSRLVGAWLAACGYAPDAVAVGTLSRQIRTAEICLETMGAGPARADWLTLEGLDEIESQEIMTVLRPDFATRGAMQAELARSPDPRRTFQTLYNAAIDRWTSGEHDGDYALTWAAYRDAVLAAFARLTHLPARSVFAFTSGGPITAMVAGLLSMPDRRAFEINWPLVNTGVTRIRFSARDGKASLSFFNAYPHLERETNPALVTFR